MSEKQSIEPVSAIELFRGVDDLWRVLLQVGRRQWAVVIPNGSLDDFRRAGVPVRVGHAGRVAHWKESSNG